MMSELINILSRLLRFLQSHDVRYAIVVENYLKRLESANTEDEINRIVAEARERMLGGMGSLNDVWICNENGHIVDDEKWPIPSWSDFAKNCATCFCPNDLMWQRA